MKLNHSKATDVSTLDAFGTVMLLTNSSKHGSLASDAHTGPNTVNILDSTL